MKKHFASMLTLTALAFAGVTAAGDKAAPKIDGTWIETAGIADGKKLPDDLIAQRKIVIAFKDGKYSFSVGGKKFEEGTYKIDPSKMPIAIDLDDTEGIDKWGPHYGVLKLDGKTLVLSFNILDRKKRPANFESGRGIAVYFLKRK